jgi:D-arabinitol 4-dehydrogenase
MQDTSKPLLMLHLGLGSFHRAHQALYLHQLQQSGDLRWALAGGNIRADMAETIEALIAQNGAYTLETVTPQGQRSYTRITSIQTVVRHDHMLSGLVQLGSDANTRIISFTVTEAGYYLDDKDKLDLNFADLQADLEALKAGNTGSTIYGALATILKARMLANAGSVTLLNCDNLRHNGDRSRSGLLQFISLLGDSALLDWVNIHTSSPNAMVDRITPRPTAEVRARVLSATGVDDAAALMCESFIQWVIEDNFIAGRPAWESVGVEMVASVHAYEEAKIRLLNATHSCIAWAGTLVGYEYIHQGTQDSVIRRIAYDYVTDDAIPVLDTPEKPSPLDLRKYRDVVLDRFSNPAICDTNQRVAMDGYTKISGFILPTIRDRLSRSESIKSVAMLPALFLTYLIAWCDKKITSNYQDQILSVDRATEICNSIDPIGVFARDSVLWGNLAGNPHLEDALRVAYVRVSLILNSYQNCDFEV